MGPNRDRHPASIAARPVIPNAVSIVMPDCIVDGYFENGVLHPGYISRETMQPRAEEMSRAGLTKSQLRKFFHYCRCIEARLKSRQSTWKAEAIEFLKLDSYADYAFTKDKARIPQQFYNFITFNVKAVKTDRDFCNGFLPHFEALVCYFPNDMSNRGSR